MLLVLAHDRLNVVDLKPSTSNRYQDATNAPRGSRVLTHATAHALTLIDDESSGSGRLEGMVVPEGPTAPFTAPDLLAPLQRLATEDTPVLFVVAVGGLASIPWSFIHIQEDASSSYILLEVLRQVEIRILALYTVATPLGIEGLNPRHTRSDGDMP
jgi:hypothetical protein